jgi:hypothetical protein
VVHACHLSYTGSISRGVVVWDQPGEKKCETLAEK